MDILILGGTLFLGRHIAATCFARGHRVTLFNRGNSGPDLFQEAVHLHGDRDGNLSALDGGRWDAVIDTSGYVPRVVDVGAALLADRAGFYVFVSSASVYADLSPRQIAEDAPVAVLDDVTNEEVGKHYGALKALCERAVDHHFRGRALHVRAGLILGSHDATGRLEYWIRRVREGGDVLAPGRPDRAIQLIDARDLAEWIVSMAEASRAGTFNVTGPAGLLTMGELLESCRIESASSARFTWVDGAFLLEREVAPFSDLPLWLPEALNGLMMLDLSSVLKTGLALRPLADTIEHTARWLEAADGTGASRPKQLASGVKTGAGLDRARERSLLDAWEGAC